MGWSRARIPRPARRIGRSPKADLPYLRRGCSPSELVPLLLEDAYRVEDDRDRRTEGYATMRMEAARAANEPARTSTPRSQSTGAPGGVADCTSSYERVGRIPRLAENSSRSCGKAPGSSPGAAVMQSHKASSRFPSG